MDPLNHGFDVVWRLLTEALSLIPFKPPAKAAEIDRSSFKTNYQYVFVSGFWSWGTYKKCYDKSPYWGFWTGENYVKSFNASGIPFVAADVSPLGSAWDRACELYAQLTGTVVDYGRAHSEKFHHTRYGEDYTGRGLLKEWDSVNKINIICHSFGGPTSALFATLLDEGSEEERAATPDGSLSPLFEGGRGDWIHSITGIAGAYNGTSLVVGKQSIEATEQYLKELLPLSGIDPLFKALQKVANYFETLTDGKTPDPDTGLYDMVPDNSVELNKTIKTVKNIYYFTVPCCTTKLSVKKDAQIPDMKITDGFFWLFCEIIGMVDMTTPGGIRLGDDWQVNDGLVNTVSEYGPANEEKTFLHTPASKKVAEYKLNKGYYYVLETYRGSHNSLCGGTIRPNRPAKNYLLGIIEMINSLE